MGSHQRASDDREDATVPVAETEPLLEAHRNETFTRSASTSYGALDTQFPSESSIAIIGEQFDVVPHSKRQLGLISVTFLIFNRVIGTGIFATPSLILQASGSVGMTFIIWVIGAIIAAAGTAVYVEFGTALPRNGGEKNYLEYIYRHPPYLMTCMYAMFALFYGWSSANAVVFGEYSAHALSLPTTHLNARIIALLSLLFAFVVHSVKLNWGLRLQNLLGAMKLVLLLSIAFAGLLSLVDAPGFRLPRDKKPRNFDSDEIWKGTRLEANAFVTALYNVIWSYIGYANANYALSEVRDPVRNIKRAAPLAMFFVFIVYMLVNIAYFAIVPKDEILGGGRIVAALFFRNLFGPNTEKVLSLIIALSTLGNILAVQFSQGRVVQELGREGIIPFSSILASSKPFNAPFAAMLQQWFMSSITAVVPPPGDAYNFILALSSYPLAVINTLISGGLIFLHMDSKSRQEWKPPFRAYSIATIFFFLSNLFLTFAPFIPPAEGFIVYEHLPYWLHAVVGVGIVLLGGLYWLIWWKWLPERGHYKLVKKEIVQEDGVSRNSFLRVPDSEPVN